MEETFEPGLKSPFIFHVFQEGERGMKCRQCERVMTLAEWQEKEQTCFCGQADFVEAIARRPINRGFDNRTNAQNPPSSNPSRNNTPPRNSRSQLQWRDSSSDRLNPPTSQGNTPPRNSRYQLQWRDSNSDRLNSPTSRSNTRSRNSRISKWVGIAALVVLGIIVFSLL